MLQDIPILDITEDAEVLAAGLVSHGPLPTKAAEDALHVALAAVNGIEYLVTWNCRHLANAVIRRRIEIAVRQAGYEPPIICTPQELIDG